MFETAESFQKKIYVKKRKTKQSLIEVIVQYVEEHNIDYEAISPFVSGKLKADLREEYEQLHFLPKTRKFPDIFGNARGNKRKVSSY